MMKLTQTTEVICACNGCSKDAYTMDYTKEPGSMAARNDVQLYDLVTPSGWTTRLCMDCLKNVRQLIFNVMPA